MVERKNQMIGNFMRLIICSSIIILLFVLLPPPAANAANSLSQNSRGNEVIALQQQLKRLNYTITSIDGIFGLETKQAVLEFQRDQRIKINGIVDGQTWRAIKKATPIVKKRATTPAVAQINYSNKQIPEGSPFITTNMVPPIIQTAKHYIGVPYQFGGTTPKGFDCSGYLQYVFAQQKISIPRTADEQYRLGKTINRSALQSGDLVFFTTYESGPSHCGIYIGDGKFIHTSSSKGVRIDELDNPYWKPKYIGAKRITT
jgi:cell wall-associated NlpC family hydrolase